MSHPERAFVGNLGALEVREAGPRDNEVQERDPLVQGGILPRLVEVEGRDPQPGRHAQHPPVRKSQARCNRARATDALPERRAGLAQHARSSGPRVTSRFDAWRLFGAIPRSGYRPIRYVSGSRRRRSEKGPARILWEQGSVREVSMPIPGGEGTSPQGETVPRRLRVYAYEHLVPSGGR